MYRVSHGSHYMEAESKDQLLQDINNWWSDFYNREWNSGRYWYDVLKYVNLTYFNDNFKMTRSEANDRIDLLDKKCLSNEIWSHVKLKLSWYVKYGPKTENSKQLNIYDYLEGEEEL